MARHLEREFDASLGTPGAAREFARTALGMLLDRPVPEDLCDDAQLIVSELVTNAVRAGTATVAVALALGPGHLRIDVRDTAPGVPSIGVRDVSSGNGRGLPLVAAVAARWGIDSSREGKSVWAELNV